MQCSLRFSSAVTFALILASVAPATLLAQASGGSSPSPSIPLPGSQSPFLGSSPEGTATSEILQIDFKDAIDRGLRTNLGLLLAGDQAQAARGERWKELAELLPNLSIRGQEAVQTQSLTALGLKASVFHAPVPRVIGPFNYFDLRANATQSLFNYKYLEKERAATESLKAAQLNFKDARELVVLAVGNSYLQAIAAAARVETADAQVKSAQAVYDKAADQQKAGVIPAIDALRSQVELQSRQQQLIVARNDLAKADLGVARIIGLPPGQQFVLTEKAPYEAMTPLPLDTYIQRAYAGRSDYQAAVAQLHSAELSRRAAAAGRYPSLDLDANFGDIGITPA